MNNNNKENNKKNKKINDQFKNSQVSVQKLSVLNQQSLRQSSRGLKRWKMTNPRRGPDPHGQSGRIEPLLGF
jgi:hypothetical protein